MSAAWVFHHGALGDSVLLWPRLRVLLAKGMEVTLVTDASKGRLAARELGVAHENAEQPRFHALWQERAPIEAVRGVEMVIDHLSPHSTSLSSVPREDLASAVALGMPHGPAEPGPCYADAVRVNLARMFPRAAIESSPPPTGSDARSLGATDTRAMPEPCENRGGPVVMHVGAGSEAKRWAVERWVELASALRAQGRTVGLIAGEVEAERFRTIDRAAFESAGGRFLGTLDPLADMLRGASVFVGGDSGPTHLAAQLGVRTVALFGPTDPAVWGPAGPRVVVVAPGSARGMEWLEVASVLSRMPG